MPVKLIICAVIVLALITTNVSIFGGKEEPIYKFPNQVAILYENNVICGGIIFDERTIITAAHCLISTNCSDFSVRIGHRNKNKGVKYNVINMVKHENYITTMNDYDIALFKLDFPIKFSIHAHPLPLMKPDDLDVVLKGKETWVSGWGRTDGEDMYPNNLHAVMVKVISNIECKERYTRRTIDGEIYYSITNNMLCAYKQGKDACDGDSGGPLVYNNIVVGMVSWGIKCGIYPGVYVRISEFYHWILQKKKLTSIHDEL